MRSFIQSLKHTAIPVLLAFLFAWNGTGLPSKVFADDPESSDKITKWKALSNEDKERLRQTYRLWKDLNDDDKQKIFENYKKFKSFSKDEQNKITKNYSHFNNMDSTQRKVLLERYKKWLNMSPEQRELLKKRYQILLNMHPEDQTKFYENYETWKRLTADKKQDMLATWSAMSPSQQQGLLNKYKGAFSLERQEEIKRILKKIRKEQLERNRSNPVEKKPASGGVQ